jgi:hypothetical protein
VAGGVTGCQELFDQLSARTLEGLDVPYPVRRLAVDCYCLQHPDRYCVSAKSLAAHLTGACWALEFGGGEQGLKALQSWLNGRVPLTKPGLPSSFGDVTVADVTRAAGVAKGVEAWARSTWESYSELHAIARDWVRAATGRD